MDPIPSPALQTSRGHSCISENSKSEYRHAGQIRIIRSQLTEADAVGVSKTRPYEVGVERNATALTGGAGAGDTPARMEDRKHSVNGIDINVLPVASTACPIRAGFNEYRSARIAQRSGAVLHS
jgi:hypothetical protein